MPTIIDFIQLIEDTARQNSLVIPHYVDVRHPLPAQYASIIMFNGVDAIGSRNTEFLARNDAV
jgi:hypothetical protein